MAEDRPPNSKHVLLGIIRRVHGIKGDVVLSSFTEPPENITSYGALVDQSGQRSFKVHVKRVKGEQVTTHIEGIDDRTAAEALRGTELYVEREQLPPVDEEEFYHADLVGLAAITADGDRIGDVVSVQNFGAGDLLELRLVDGKRTKFIPFSASWVPSVDLAAGTITVVMPESDDDGDDSREA